MPRSPGMLLPVFLALLLGACYATPARHRGAVWTATVTVGSGRQMTYRIIEAGEDYAGEVVVAGTHHPVEEAHHEHGVFTGFAIIGSRMQEVRLEHIGDGSDEVGEYVDALDRVQRQHLRFRREQE